MALALGQAAGTSCAVRPRARPAGRARAGVARRQVREVAITSRRVTTRGFRDLLGHFTGDNALYDGDEDEDVGIMSAPAMSRVTFKLHYDTRLGQELFIVGSDPMLGAWDCDKALRMRWTGGGVWAGNVELPAGGVYFYKYFIREGPRVMWQGVANSMLVLDYQTEYDGVD